MIATYPKEKRALADFMKHGEDVQDRYYNRTQSAAGAARMANMVAKTLTGQVTTDADHQPQVFSTVSVSLIFCSQFWIRKSKLAGVPRVILFLHLLGLKGIHPANVQRGGIVVLDNLLSCLSVEVKTLLFVFGFIGSVCLHVSQCMCEIYFIFYQFQPLIVLSRPHLINSGGDFSFPRTRLQVLVLLIFLLCVMF